MWKDDSLWERGLIKVIFFFTLVCQIPKGLAEEIEAADEVIKKGSVSQF